uniref:AIR carboxylase family protein n=1 Tax=Blastococcus atacamensis TaxID=2070508 RepID=UPI0018E49586
APQEATQAAPPAAPSPMDDALRAVSAVLAEEPGFAPLLDRSHAPLGAERAAEPLLGPLPAAAGADAEPVVLDAEPVVVDDVEPVVVDDVDPAALGTAAGAAEADVVWATGRTTEQVLTLVREARREFPDRPVLVLRAVPETLVALATEHGATTTLDAAASAAAVGPVPEPSGRVAVLCSGGADAPVAAEAAFVARVSGTEVVRVDDVAGSRTRSLLADRTLFADTDCLVVVAGMEASLATMVGALTDVPVVAVPTSTGQPSAFGGLGALMTMLTAATPGMTVSNIDNGYSAGVFAARVARRSGRTR